MFVDGSHKVESFPHYTQFSKFSTPHTMFVDGSHIDRKLSTQHRMSVDRSHGDRKLSTVHLKPRYQSIVHSSHDTVSFPRCINYHDINQLSTSHTIFATSIFVITQLSNQEY